MGKIERMDLGAAGFTILVALWALLAAWLGQAALAAEVAPTALKGPSLVEVARDFCPNNRSPDGDLVAELFRIEAEAGLEAAGLLAAAACIEAGYSPTPRGTADGGRAKGMFQFWAWAKRAIGPASTKDPRLDWRASAAYWARHTVALLPKAKRCPKTKRGYVSRQAALWASAATTAVRGPRPGRAPYCARAGKPCTESKHACLWRQWQSIAQGQPVSWAALNKCRRASCKGKG